jgi:hypothetical protein
LSKASIIIIDGVVGKTGNVVVANGDPLDVRTSVKQVFVGGNAIPMVSRQTKLRDEYMPIATQKP